MESVLRGTWKELAEADPALAETGSNQLFQYRVGLVCPVLSDSHLYILVLPNSPKGWDLQRDCRYSLQAFPQGRPDSDEFNLSGITQLVSDLEKIGAMLADAKHHVSVDEIPFELLIGRAMRTTWEGP